MTTETAASGGGASDLDLFEEEATGQASSTETKASPDKYSGKGVEDLIKMHQNAERLASRQGAELGQLRKYADALIELKKPPTQTTEERKPVTIDALLNDPEKAISIAVANSPLAQRAAAAESRVAQLEARITESEFVGKHSNVSNDINDPAFLEWVNKNPLRQALAANAAKEGDVNRFVAAKNLWDMWDEHKELVSGSQRQAPGNGGQRSQKTVPTTVKSAPADLANKGKPIYSRAKLMELRAKVERGDPAAKARWSDQTFQTNMIQAYADDRVR